MSTALPIKPHDGHVHVDAWAGAGQTHHKHPASGSVECLLETLNSAGVEKAAVITPQTMGWDNRFTLQVASTHPDRLVPVARIDVFSSSVLAEARKLLAAGSRGFRLCLQENVEIERLYDGTLVELFCTFAAHEAPVLFHGRPDQLPSIGKLAARHPDLTVLIDHLGRPDVPKGIDDPGFRDLLDLAVLSNIVVKTPNSRYFSAQHSRYSDLDPFVDLALVKFGPERLLWGSDWPLCVVDGEYDAAFEPTTSVMGKRSSADQRAVFRGNFERIFCTS